MKRSVHYVVMMYVFFLILLQGCTPTPPPKDVLSQYLTAIYQSDYAKSYELLSDSDKKMKSKEAYCTPPQEVSPLIKALSGKTTFNIKNVTISGDKANATVDVTQPDIASVAGELFGKAMFSAMAGKSAAKDIEKSTLEKLNDNKIPTVTRVEQFDLVREKGGWRVYLSWENERKRIDLRNEAERLEKAKKFTEAKAKYMEIKSILSKDESATKKIIELDDKIAKYKEKELYFPNVEIRNVQIGKGILGEKGVFGEVKNKGSKSLKLIEITTYCLDKAGQVVFEKPYHPVLVVEHSFTMGDNQPLKPNYSRQFGCKLSDAPSDWSGKVRVAVTDVEFE